MSLTGTVVLIAGGSGALGRTVTPSFARAGARVITSFILGAMVQLAVNPSAFDFRELAALLERWIPKPESARETIG